MREAPFTKKALGQHWLHDEKVLNAMCEAGGVNKADTVLEIGPGVGTLTQKLVEQAREVIAVELDEVLAMQLPFRIPDENLQVVQQDILSFDLTALPRGYKVVANIPYYLTSNLIRNLSESINPPIVAVILVQKEVAERVASAPGDMSVLSVTAQFYWRVSLGEKVSAQLFTPPPKVDSQILILHAREQPLFPEVEPKQFFRLVKAGFSARRKTLLNSLSGGLHLDKPQTEKLLKDSKLDPTARPQGLSLTEWHTLYRHLSGNV